MPIYSGQSHWTICACEKLRGFTENTMSSSLCPEIIWLVVMWTWEVSGIEAYVQRSYQAVLLRRRLPIRPKRILQEYENPRAHTAYSTFP
jgi:hypothetical protein